MNAPEKGSWFVQYLDEKFKTLSDQIENNKLEHDASRTELLTAIDKVDEKHDSKHKETRTFFLMAIAVSAVIFIKESRDFIIAAIKFIF